MRLFSAVITFIFLTGCTTTLYKDGASQQDYQRDMSQEVDAALRKKDLIIKCMNTKGWEVRRQ